MIETEFSAGNLQLAALENQGAGTVVIGLHGFLDNAESLRLLAPYLQTHRFIALDLAGHGRSSHRPIGSHYNQADYLQDLHALIESQDWEHVILLGHSMVENRWEHEENENKSERSKRKDEPKREKKKRAN